MKHRSFCILILTLLLQGSVYGQTLPVGFPIVEEYARRSQLFSNTDSIPFSIRPRNQIGSSTSQDHFRLLPALFTTQSNTNRPYGWGDYGMIPNRGIQQFASVGITGRYKFINFQFNPEITIAQNKNYQGFPNDFSESIINSKFLYWNIGDSPERFGNKTYTKFWWGQSKLTAQFGAFEIGASTQNIWWGPGQWNALTFSNNAQGFPHLSFSTRKPAKTFLGNFEGQVLIGRLENTGLAPLQDDRLNDLFFVPFSGDWRYLNAMMVSYTPKWIPGLHLGFSRTYQQYSKMMGNSFGDYFPIFDPFQKTQVGFDKDGDGRDQQATLFFRWVIPAIKGEFYAEFGRRDHAYDWREATLTPEHARAYLMGFSKLFDLSKPNQFIQVRGEITHQQESVNRYIRNEGLGGGSTWHTHGTARGFTQNGQPLGVGIGTGSNVQTLEISLVEKFNKYGILLERLENQQDFYYRAFGQQNEHKPWIDLSIGFLADHQWNNLLLSSKVQLINAHNYQWQLAPSSSPEFPKGQNLFSVHSQVSLVYLWKR